MGTRLLYIAKSHNIAVRRVKALKNGTAAKANRFGKNKIIETYLYVVYTFFFFIQFNRIESAVLTKCVSRNVRHRPASGAKK